MNSERWRLFVGLLLPAEHCERLAALQQELVKAKLAVRWIKPANFHITLHFLGDVAAEAVPGLQEQLTANLAGCLAPVLALDGLGAFPHLGKPHVLWAGVCGTLERVTSLHERAVAAGETIGVAPEERAYNPHITLGYMRKDSGRAKREAIASQINAQPIPELAAAPYTQVALMRSVLQREGAIYTALETWELGDEE